MTLAARPLAFAFSTLGLPHAGWEEAAALARDFGFNALELRALRGRIDLPAVLRDEFGEPAALVRAVAESGLRVASLDASLRLLNPTDEHRQEVLELAAWADAIGAPYIRVFEGGDVFAAREPAVRAALARELEAWAQLRTEHGLRCDLAVETHWALNDPADCAALARETEAPLNLLWDVCHTWEGRPGSDPLADWEVLRPIVRHIHVKDARRNPDAKHGFDHTLPGEGELPVPALLDALARDGYAGTVSLEWESFWEPELPPLRQALESGRTNGWW